MPNLKLLDRLPGENNKDYACRVLLDNIISLELAPRTKLSENDIASQLGLSRTPVREALMELSKLELVEIYPQRGTYVSPIDRKVLNDAITGRAAIECVVVAEAAIKATPEHIQTLSANLTLQELYLDSTTWLDYDKAFHKLIYEIADRMFLYRQMKNMTIPFDRIRSGNRRDIQNNRINYQDHQRIAAAITNHDPEAAKEATYDHIFRFYSDKWDELIDII